MDMTSGKEEVCRKSRCFLDDSPTWKSSDDGLLYKRVHAVIEQIKKREKRVEVRVWEEGISGYSKKNRIILLQWMMDFCNDHGLSVETYHLAVCLLDRFMSICGNKYVNRGNLQLAGVAALLVSAKNTVKLEMCIDE